MNSYRKPVSPVSPPAPYIGGKRFLSSDIIDRIDRVPHELYAEPFVGMGGVFFRRAWRPAAEVINDANGEVVNLFRILQRHYAAFMEFLKYQLTSRKEFERLSATVPSTLTDLERAGRFLYLQRTAYGGKVVGQNFGMTGERPARFDLTQLAPILEEIYERLAGVVIEGLDWSAFVDQYDRPGTLFYFDPPYWGSETDYGASFPRADFERLAATLRDLKGFGILSINDVPEIREVFAGLPFEGFDLTYTIGQATGGTKDVKELLFYSRELPKAGLF